MQSCSLLASQLLISDVLNLHRESFVPSLLWLPECFARAFVFSIHMLVLTLQWTLMFLLLLFVDQSAATFIRGFSKPLSFSSTCTFAWVQRFECQIQVAIASQIDWTFAEDQLSLVQQFLFASFENQVPISTIWFEAQVQNSLLEIR